MSVQKGFALLPHTKNVFGHAKWKENSFQICIEFPFNLYKRMIAGEAAHKQLKAKKEKKHGTSTIAPENSLLVDIYVNEYLVAQKCQC